MNRTTRNSRYPSICAFVLWLMLMAPLPLMAQQFLNGSFERNTADSCAFNLQNNRFTPLMEATYAFGANGEVDIMTEVCGYGDPVDGRYFLALSAQGVADAIALKLATPLQAGERYAIAFYEKGGGNTFSQYGVEIGLSSQPDDFGALLYTSSTLSLDWVRHELNFVAPQAGRYLTVRANAGVAADSWVFVDHFTQECPPGFSLGPDTAVCRLEPIVLTLPDWFDRYQWSTGATGTRLRIDVPGWYWVRAQLRDCEYVDSLLVSTYPNECRCWVWAASAFTPNQDGINDRFEAFTNCGVEAFELRIFDRVGQLVFQTDRMAEAWDGDHRGQPCPEGTYAYVLRYRFAFQQRMRRSSGTVTLLR